MSSLSADKFSFYISIRLRVETQASIYQLHLKYSSQLQELPLMKTFINLLGWPPIIVFSLCARALFHKPLFKVSSQRCPPPFVLCGLSLFFFFF